MTVTDPASHQLDAELAALAAARGTWAARSLSARRDLLQQTKAAVAACAGDWVRVACGIKGLDPASRLAGEEWLSGPYAVLTALRDYADALTALAENRSPVDGFRIVAAPGGRRAVQVLPHRVTDRLLLSGHRVHVWMRPGLTDDVIRADAGLAQRTPTCSGVGVVLGAGNITSIPVLDVLYELLAHDRLSLLKLNPITDALLPVLNRALAPLVEAGVLAITTGDAAAGEHLVTSPRIDHVHLTGSAATYRAIVGGRSASRGPLAVPVTAELGGVSPILVVPGRWSRRDLQFQAEHVATMRLQNNGYNCVAGQVLVVSADWPQLDDFLTEVRAALDGAPHRPDYYSGSADRVAAAVAEYPDAELVIGRVLIPEAGSGTATSTEYFAPVLAVTRINGVGLEFFRRAVELANGRLTGNLGANILIDPRTRRAAGARFDELIAELRYGTVAVNAWTGVGFATAAAPWGAFPDFGRDHYGAPDRFRAAEDCEIGSGVGIVHNALLLREPERTVVQGPFRPFPRSLAGGEVSLMPRPPWFVNSRTGPVTCQRMTGFAADGRWTRLPGVLWSALRG